MQLTHYYLPVSFGFQWFLLIFHKPQDFIYAFNILLGKMINRSGRFRFNAAVSVVNTDQRVVLLQF